MKLGICHSGATICLFCKIVDPKNTLVLEPNHELDENTKPGQKSKSKNKKFSDILRTNSIKVQFAWKYYCHYFNYYQTSPELSTHYNTHQLLISLFHWNSQVEFQFSLPFLSFHWQISQRQTANCKDYQVLNIKTIVNLFNQLR